MGAMLQVNAFLWDEVLVDPSLLKKNSSVLLEVPLGLQCSGGQG